METLDTSTDSFRKNFKKRFPSQLTMSKILKQCGPYLTELTLCNGFNYKIIPVVRDYCHNLLKLKLDFNKHEEKYFVNAFSKLNKLKSISINAYRDYPIYDCDWADTKMLESVHEGIEEIYFESDTSSCYLSDHFAAVSLFIFLSIQHKNCFF